jgi:hypothetical protein
MNVRALISRSARFVSRSGLALSLGAVVAASIAPPVSAQNPPLACAVTGTGSADRAQELCRGVGQQLGRATLLVEDGTSVVRGDALHIVQGDVAWLVVWLRDGEPRAFTRVSSVDAAGRELTFLARASRALSREANKPAKGCVRVEPNGGLRMRVPELAHPWVQLKQCRERVVDVIDPWWTPR